MPKFQQVDILQRERDVEGEIGVWLRITDTIYLHTLCQSDANPRFRTHGPRMLREINRLANAGASPEELDKAWAGFHSECVVIGWRGVVEEGEPATETEEAKPGPAMPFSKANYIGWACRNQRIRFVLEEWSKDETNYRRSKAAGIADQLGN